MMRKIICLFIIFSVLPNINYAQTEQNIRKDALKIFVDCNFCDLDFIKREITFVNFVRDSKEAQVHILSTRQNAGNGGKEYSFIFLGQQKFINKNDTLSFVSMADNTADEIREKQVKFIKLGLIQYASHTELAKYLDINYIDNNSENSDIVTDKWNSWVFKLNSQTWLRGESSYSNFYLWSSLSAERITPEWKLIFRARNNFSESKFVIDENETYITINRSYFGKASVVKSINEHWSVGGEFNAGSSTYGNYDFYSNIYPAIEYNVFPYSQSSVKQLTFRITSGYKYADYTDTTIYDKTIEHLGIGKLATAYKINKKWGSINTTVSGTSFMHDFSKYNIDIRTTLEIRIIKGLSLQLSGGGSLIRNQLNLKKEGASYEEILLRQQQVATDYSYWMSAGLSYTFGSIYNNVVNPRFGN